MRTSDSTTLRISHRDTPGTPAVSTPGMPPPETDGMDLFRKLWRRKGLILASAVAGGVLASLAALTFTPRYSAETRVLIGREMPNVANIPEVLQEMAASQEAVQSQSYIMTSRNLGAQVAERLALDQDPEFNPALRTKPTWERYVDDAKAWLKGTVKDVLKATGMTESKPDPDPPSEDHQHQRREQIVVSQLLSRIEVVPLQRSQVLAINAQSQNPETAARIANTLADTYIEEQMIRRSTATENATDWLDQRIADLRDKVESSERAVEEYRQEHDLFETQNNQVTAQQLTQLNSQLIVAESEQATAEARLEQVKKVERNQQPVASLPSVVNSPLIQALLQRQVEAERKAAELGSTLGPEHPQMLDIDAQIADIKKRIDREVSKVVQAQRHEVKAANARVTELRQNLGQLQNRLGQNNEKSIRLHELERQAEANRQLLVNFLDRAKEAESQPNAKEQSSVVISEAAVPLSPSFPPTTMLRALGVVGGVLIGMLIALMRENLDRTFRTTRQVEEATELPVLGVLPPSEHSLFGRANSFQSSSSLFGHAIGNLYERLVAAPEMQARKVVMLTSATPKEGKSQIALNLARTVTQSGLRAIVVDCDWRRPSMHDFFSQSATPGLGDLLAGKASSDEAVYRDSSTGIHAIFAGDISPLANSTERFARLRLLLGTLSRHYDLVLVDTPPVLAGPEARILARMMDEVAFVVRWGQVSQDIIIDAIRDLAFTDTNFGGVILSDVDPKQYRRYGMGDVLYPYPAKHAT